jgi:predicted acyl esterase
MMDVVVEKSAAAPMRDGMVLRADVYRPAAPGRYAVLLQRTPYNKEMWLITAVTLDPVRAPRRGSSSSSRTWAHVGHRTGSASRRTFTR